VQVTTVECRVTAVRNRRGGTASAISFQHFRLQVTSQPGRRRCSSCSGSLRRWLRRQACVTVVRNGGFQALLATVPLLSVAAPAVVCATQLPRCYPGMLPGSMEAS